MPAAKFEDFHLQTGATADANNGATPSVFKSWAPKARRVFREYGGQSR